MNDKLNDEVKVSAAEARGFAIAAHGHQRYGEQPYVYHLDRVAKLLKPYGEEAQAVGYLHDVLEDTKTSFQLLAETFGPSIANAVHCVTDPTDYPDRKRRKLIMNGVLRSLNPNCDAHRLALIVKAADRLANLRESVKGGGHAKLEMYRGEHAAFREAAYRPGLCDELWEEMDAIVRGGANE